MPVFRAGSCAREESDDERRQFQQQAVRDAVAAGKLKGSEKLPAKMVLTIDGVSLTHEIAGEIELG